MCKKRKEKKLNMQGKGNMVLSYFIINIHMQLKRRRLVTIFPILKAKREIHVEKEKKGSHQGRRQVAASKGRKELLVYSSYAHTRGVKERKRWQFSSFVGGIYSQSFIIHYTHLDQRTKEKKLLI